MVNQMLLTAGYWQLFELVYQRTRWPFFLMDMDNGLSQSPFASVRNGEFFYLLISAGIEMFSAKFLCSSKPLKLVTCRSQIQLSEITAKNSHKQLTTHPTRHNHKLEREGVSPLGCSTVGIAPATEGMILNDLVNRMYGRGPRCWCMINQRH